MPDAGVEHGGGGVIRIDLTHSFDELSIPVTY